jgi:hypothetical protein
MSNYSSSYGNADGCRVDEGQILGELELPPAMRGEPMQFPDTLHGGGRHTDDLIAIAGSVQCVASCRGASEPAVQSRSPDLQKQA